MFYCSYVHIIKTENHFAINITRKKAYIFRCAKDRRYKSCWFLLNAIDKFGCVISWKYLHACSIHNGLLLCVQFRGGTYVCVYGSIWGFLVEARRAMNSKLKFFLARTRILCVSRRYCYTDPRVFPPKKSHVKLFSPPDIYVDYIRAKHELWISSFRRSVWSENVMGCYCCLFMPFRRKITWCE